MRNTDLDSVWKKLILQLEFNFVGDASLKKLYMQYLHKFE